MYAKRKWHKRGSSNSIGVKAVTPRLNLITAVDNFGESYLSVLQSNGDSSVLKVYLSYLTKLLDKKDHNWRDNTILLLDGASAHTADETDKHMKGLNLPVMITAPYSYDACPCELWFSMLKSVELNIQKLGTGKR
jgi:hypothetical protein